MPRHEGNTRRPSKSKRRQIAATKKPPQPKENTR